MGLKNDTIGQIDRGRRWLKVDVVTIAVDADVFGLALNDGFVFQTGSTTMVGTFKTV